MFEINPEIKAFWKNYNFIYQLDSKYGEILFLIDEKGEAQYDRCSLATQNSSGNITYYYPPGSANIRTEQEMLKLIKLKAFL